MNRMGFANVTSSGKNLRSPRKGKSPSGKLIILKKNEGLIAKKDNRPRVLKSDLLMKYPFPHFLEITSTLDIDDEDTRSSNPGSQIMSSLSTKYFKSRPLVDH